MFIQLGILMRSSLTSMHTMSIRSSLSIFPSSGTVSTFRARLQATVEQQFHI